MIALRPNPTLAIDLASPFTDHAVFQRNAAVPIWGTADPGERIAVSFGSQKKTAVAGEDGRWSLALDPLPVSATPQRLIVRSATDEQASPIELDDILVGEVWLMVGAPVDSASAAAPTPATETETAPRAFVAESVRAAEPQTALNGQWQSLSANSSPSLQAVAAFSSTLQGIIGVPIGVIVLPASGAPQAWMRREAILADSALAPALADFDARVKAYTPPNEDDFKRWQKAAAAAKKPAKGKKRRPIAPVRGDPIQLPQSPTVAYNAMIAPLVPYALHGILWQPDESPLPVADLAMRWDELLIQDWRKLWGAANGSKSSAELPFYFAEARAVRDPERWRALETAALRLPGTARIATLDLDRAKAASPNQTAIGERFARVAAALADGKKLEYSGPQLGSITGFGGSVRLRFTHTTGGLVVRGDSLTAFEVAGADGVFHAADAHIDGNTVYLSSPDVAVPLRVRYGWQSNASQGGLLFNGEGLPAPAFEANAAAN